MEAHPTIRAFELAGIISLNALALVDAVVLFIKGERLSKWFHRASAAFLVLLGVFDTIVFVKRGDVDEQRAGETTALASALDKERHDREQQLADRDAKLNEANRKVRELTEAERRRADDEATERALERTPPRANAFLARDQHKIWNIVIDADNDVPFKADWVLVTKNNRIIGPIMMGPIDIYPKNEKGRRGSQPIDYDPAQILDEYVELRFNYTSIYAAKLGNPKELEERRLTKAYRYWNHDFFPLVPEKASGVTRDTSAPLPPPVASRADSAIHAD